MFTGLIQTMGRVLDVTRRSGGVTIRIEARFPGTPLEKGESIAVDGACLTVERISANDFEAFASEETLSRTTLKNFQRNYKVNLERAATPASLLGGHIVQGHVDCVGTVLDVISKGETKVLKVRAQNEIVPYLVTKGSIAVNGVSLTINKVAGSVFEVMVIPETLRSTNLGLLRPSSLVNLESDIIAKLVFHAVKLLYEDKQSKVGTGITNEKEF